MANITFKLVNASTEDKKIVIKDVDKILLTSSNMTVNPSAIAIDNQKIIFCLKKP